MQATMTDHARRACETRAIPVEAVQAIVDSKLTEANYTRARDIAVFVGRTRDRGSLVGSNGDCVWAIVRDGEVATVMLRRSNQPSTRAALRVDAVIGEQYRKAVAA
jgi:hypothetical protein